METISNEQKAKEFATTHDGKIIGFAHIAALQMAQWKDEQHEQEKQKLIDKAVEYISIHTLKTMSAKDIHNIIVDFKNAMKNG